MNKTNLLFFIPIFLVLELNSHCIQATELPKELLCPEKIECLRDKSVSSCKAFSETLEFWGKIQANGTVKTGTYLLRQVQSSYQNPYVGFSSHCEYLHNDYPEVGLAISTPSEYNANAIHWEAVHNDNSQWLVNGFFAQCENYGLPINPKACPLKAVPMVKILSPVTANIMGVAAYANGILLSDVFWLSCSDNLCIQTINIYQAWDACSDTGLCTIEFMTKFYESFVDAGRIVVDMENKMKIVDVYPNAGFEISLDKEKNSVEINTSNSFLNHQ